MRSSAAIFCVLGILALLAAIVFPIVSHEPAGSAMLGIFAVSMLYIAWELSRGATTDKADDEDAEAEVGPEHVFPSSWWPIVMAVAVLIVAVGIKFSLVVAAVGGAILLASAVGWFSQRVPHGAAEHHGEADDEIAAESPAEAETPAGSEGAGR